MRAYLTLAEGGTGRVPIEGPVAIYRDPDRDHEIVAATEDRDVPLGGADVTVSRAKGGSAPVLVEPRSGGIEIQNGGNSNGVDVLTSGGERSVEEGLVCRVERDAQVEIGYKTTLEIIIEREEGDTVIEGDVVAGNKTAVEDSVVNRSDIGGDG